MKKIFVITVLLFNLIFMPKVNAQEKLKVVMFDWEGYASLNEEENMNIVTSINGYGETFEIVKVVVRSGNDGVYNEENKELYEKTIEQYNAAYNDDLNSTSFPTYLVGKKICDTIEVEGYIKQYLKEKNYNATYECLLGDYDYNCFNGESLTKSKLQKNIAYVIPLFLFVIILLIWLCLK